MLPGIVQQRSKRHDEEKKELLKGFTITNYRPFRRDGGAGVTMMFFFFLGGNTLVLAISLSPSISISLSLPCVHNAKQLAFFLNPLSFFFFF